MASAHAKFTGELGVCMATSGPGASHLITGLYDARLDHMPVLAIVGQQARAAHRRALPAGARPAVSMFKDVAGAFVQQASVAGAGAPPGRPRRAHRRRPSARVTALIFPNDLQDEAYEEPPRKHGTVHSGVGYAAPEVVPLGRDLRRAAEVLNAGKKVAILVGAGALQAHRRGDRGRRQAGRRRRQGAARQGGAAGRPALGHRLDRPARHQAELGPDDGMRHAADGRLRLPLFRVPAEGGPGARRADRHRARHAERSATRWRSTSSATARETLAALLPLLEQKTDAPGASEIEEGVADWWKTLEDAGHALGRPGQPAARRLGAVAAPARAARSSPATAAPAPTGTRATSRSGAA